MRRWWLAVMVLLMAGLAEAQTFPTPGYFQRFFSRPQLPVQVPGTQGIEDYVAEGKLRLGLEDMIKLTLANNTDVRLDSLSLQLSAFALRRSYAPFDPMFTTTFRPTRSTSPSTSQLEGADVVSSLSHQMTMSYSQLLQTGTSYSISVGTNRSASNSSWVDVNPSYSSQLSFSFSQPLLRGFGLLPTRAPILIAQRSLKQSRADFEAQVNDSISRAINQYWDVMLSRKQVEVLQKSLELAEASYQRDKRSLELGALPPLDIYRSESQVAQRKLAIVQAQYRLRQLEDDFRRTIGADLDARFSSIPIELTENFQTSGELPVVDAQEAMEKALHNRPELQSLQLQIDNATTSAKVANQNLKPDLSLSAYYTANGTGGNLLDTDADGNRYISQYGGLNDSFDQVGSFKYPSYGVTLQLRLPLRNRGAEADLGTALVNRRRSLYSMRQRTQAITLEVRNALNQIEGAKLAIQAAQVAYELAQKNLAAEQRKYDLGVQTIFFVLDAQTQLAQAEQDVVQAEIDYRRATTALDRATGDLLARHRVEIANATN